MKNMNINITEEGIVFCNGLTCSCWIETETCCRDCPIDKLFLIVGKHFAEKSQEKTAW